MPRSRDVLPPFWTLIEAHGDELLVAQRLDGLGEVRQPLFLRALKCAAPLRRDADQHAAPVVLVAAALDEALLDHPHRVHGSALLEDGDRGRIRLRKADRAQGFPAIGNRSHPIRFFGEVVGDQGRDRPTSRRRRQMPS